MFFHFVHLKLNEVIVMQVQVWFDNVPHTRLDRGDKNGVLRKGNKLIFPGDGPQFIRGTDKYLDQISKVCFIFILSGFRVLFASI